MSVTVNTNSVVAAKGQQINLSSLVTVSGTNNPTYLLVSGLDRREYTAASNGNTGTITGNGATATFAAEGGDVSGLNILFTYDAKSGQYVNAQYGALNNLTLTASTDTDRIEDLTFFASNDASTLTGAGSSNSINVLTNANASDLGTVTVLTQPSLAGKASLLATPDAVAAAAQSFVGQTWNVNGCWVLASAIAAEAGASLPAISTEIGVTGQSNGLWMVAYNGPQTTSTDWLSMLSVGDVVVFKNASGEGHIATVVSGSGANASVIDNAAFTTPTGTISNAAPDGSASDITIAAAHSAAQALAGVAANSVVIYRLDTPVVNAASGVYLNPGRSQSLSAVASATDPAGKPVVSYQVFDTTPGDSITASGATTLPTSAATALTMTAAAFSGATVQAGTNLSAPVSGTLMVRAFNGTSWGDWASVAVTAAPSSVVTSAASIASNLSSLSAGVTAGKVTSIAMTDSGMPILTLTVPQLLANRAAVDKITGKYMLAVTADSQDATIVGSNGINKLSAGVSGGTHELDAGAGTVGTDTLTGGIGADVLKGSTSASGSAMLFGGAGRNILDGGKGKDTMVGGGASVLNAGGSNQVLLGGSTNGANDTLNSGSGGSEFMAVAAGKNVLNAGSGVGNVLEGGRGSDVLNGSNTVGGNAVMIGGSGTTTINGGLGADTLVGGGRSLLNAGNSRAQVLLGGFGATAHDTLNAGTNDATLAVAAGNNVLNAGTGAALLIAGSGNDLLTGGGGNGTLIGGSGNSTLVGGSGSDTLVGGGKSLLMGGTGGKGTSLLLGGFSSLAQDTLVSGIANGETLAVAAGNNVLKADPTGTASNALLIAGAGRDTLYGAAYGNDTPAIPPGLTTDVVTNGVTTVLGGAGADNVLVTGTGSLTFDGGGGTNMVDFTQHRASDAKFSTNSAGATVISFSNGAQTATLSHVGSVVFGLDGTTKLLT